MYRKLVCRHILFTILRLDQQIFDHTHCIFILHVTLHKSKFSQLNSQTLGTSLKTRICNSPIAVVCSTQLGLHRLHGLDWVTHWCIQRHKQFAQFLHRDDTRLVKSQVKFCVHAVSSRHEGFTVYTVQHCYFFHVS